MKTCKNCGIPIYGKARKYCPDCKRKIHLNQMTDYYCKNTSRWMYGGKYWDQQSYGKCGTGSLGEHRNKNFNIELEKIEKEMLNLQLKKPIKENKNDK